MKGAWRAALVVVVVAACGHHAPGTDASGIDGPAPTACGVGGLTCVTASEICVVHTPVGPGETYACMPVPAGCASDRTCGCAGATLCTGAFSTCSMREPNTLVCECPLCQ